MLFRFTLSHAILGSQQISECDGWKDATLKLERHEEYHSLIEYFEGDFVFYGQTNDVNGGIDFIRQVETSYGADAELSITIEIAPDNLTYQTVFIGQLDLWNLEELADNKMKVPIIRNDFWAKFINRIDTPVDIQSATNLDDTDADQFDNINLRLTSQQIQAKFSGYWSTSVQIGPMLSEEYVQIDFDNISFDEIQNRFSTIVTYNSERPFEMFAMEYAGDYTFRPVISMSYVRDDQSDSQPTDDLFDVVIQRNDDAPILLSATNINLGGGFFFTKYTIDQTFALNAGDFIRLYVNGNGDDGNYTLWVLGNDSNGFLTALEFINDQLDTSIEVIGQTILPASNAQGFFIHDVGGQLVDRSTGQDQAFYSALLGSSQTVYRQYATDGCLWPNALSKGLQIRRYSLVEKPFFLSFKQWWEGANPIFNLGLTYETISDQEVIRVEDKRHFYDDSVSLYIDYVRDIIRKYDDNRVFKSVKVGYKKWQSEDVAGIDDAQTKHTYAPILKKGGKEITLESEFIAASLAIETTRRKTREKSADYKFDNDTFIIALNPVPTSVSPETSPEVTDYLPELDENFTFIENLLNADTRYNSRLTPARNFLRWRDWLSGCLQAYPLTAFKFAAGEGNYDMSSDLADLSDGCEEYRSGLSEKEDILVSANPFHLALLYEIKIPLDWDDYVTIRDNRKKAIGISQTNENHVKFFIKELNYELVKGEATIQAWPIELMTIDVIESVTPQLICGPVDPCEDAYLTELLEELITESGDCLVLN